MPRGIYVRTEQHRAILRAYNLGKTIPEETREKIKLTLTGRINNNTARWKGDNVGYQGLHQWLRRHLPKPELCEFCHNKSPTNVANYTGIYNREFHNWKYLCRSCHGKYDGWNRGKKRSSEIKKKLSLIHKNQSPPFLGKHHSESSKEKIRLANIGKKHSSETIEKIRLSMLRAKKQS